jgi:hypothetical protein
MSSNPKKLNPDLTAKAIRENRQKDNFSVTVCWRQNVREGDHIGNRGLWQIITHYSRHALTMRNCYY